MSLVREFEKLPPEERRKISELIKSKDDQAEESGVSRLDASTSWMYEQPKRSAEDFLLGKAIRSLEELADVNRDQEEETPIQRLTRLDMEAKFREDPLNLMRQHEMDKRSALLQNTARMKKLQRLIEMQNEAKQKAEKRRAKKRLKKHQKRKKRERQVSASSSSSDSSESSEDDAILEKFISLIKKVDEVKNDGSVTALEKFEPKKEKNKERRNRHRHHRLEPERNSSQLSKVPPSFSLPDGHPRLWSRSAYPKKSLAISSHCDGERGHSRHRSHFKSPGTPPRGYLSPSQAVNSSKIRKSESGLRSQCQGKQKLSQEEMAALRDQMAADAKERESERQRRFEQHQNEKTKEEKEECQARASHGASFLRNLTLSHVASTSVEEVVQRNANKRQRGGMDQNFLRR